MLSSTATRRYYENKSEDVTNATPCKEVFTVHPRGGFKTFNKCKHREYRRMGKFSSSLLIKAMFVNTGTDLMELLQNVIQMLR